MLADIEMSIYLLEAVAACLQVIECESKADCERIMPVIEC